MVPRYMFPSICLAGGGSKRLGGDGRSSAIGVGGNIDVNIMCMARRDNASSHVYIDA